MATSSGANPVQGSGFLRDRGRNASGETIPPRLSTPTLARRRSSVLSYASDSRHSVQSSTGDIFFPSIGKGSSRVEEDSHWHSSPLLFALLPGLGGVFFHNGAAFVTDVLLLGIAALYLNWSVRQPWEWYHAAQGVVQDAAPRSPRPAQEAPASPGMLDGVSSPKSMDDSILSESPSQSNKEGEEDHDMDGEAEQEEATRALRMHESVALLMTFVLPALGAFILHLIRGQLSKGSTALVSDYNLTIFLLAAEVRPCRQLMRLVSNRTMHLQRVANGVNLAGETTEKNAAFESRLEVLEAKVAEPTASPANTTPLSAGQREEVSQLTTEIRKRYEPRIDALERAVRRYEKRVTTLTMLTDERLQHLDQRLQDALSLAAVAAQSSQKPSLVVAALSYLAGVLVVAPIEVAGKALTWPLRRAEDALGYVLGTPRKVGYSSSSSSSSYAGGKKKSASSGSERVSSSKGASGKVKEKRSHREGAATPS